MKRLSLLILLLVLSIGASAQAQRAFQFRISVPNPALGFGLEAELQRNLVALLYGDLVFRGPAVLVGGELLFKPDLGQFDRDLRGVSPYIGGGVGVGFGGGAADAGLTLDFGIEFAVDRSTGLFVGWQGIYYFDGFVGSRAILGASFR
ncbi:hypothetical protein [Calidithermus timidus]|jgi:hypothetical protein|uniref:hypothetical protein n=1 Tax=Calidithermus timidus TaxID=307124 RepID=UPI00035E4B8B|nr:hypothetical protein [Calidithermus timidus]